MLVSNFRLNFVTWSGSRRGRCAACGVSVERRKEFCKPIELNETREEALLKLKAMAMVWEGDLTPIYHRKCEPATEVV